MKNKSQQPSLSEQVSAFIRTIQLKSLRERTQEAYWVWVLRIAKHHGVACPSLLAEEEVSERHKTGRPKTQDDESFARDHGQRRS